MAVVSPAPINIQYGYDTNIVSENKTSYTKDGLFITESNLLSSTQDVVFNRDNLLFLTDTYSLADKINTFSEIDKTQLITETTIYFLSGNIVMYLSGGETVNSPLTFTDILSSATIFTLNYNGFNTVSILVSSRYITLDTSNNINLQLLRGDYDSTQVFNYSLYNNEFVLFPKVPNLIVGFDTTSKQLSTNIFYVTNFSMFEKFYLGKYYFNSTNRKGSSNNVKYVTTPNDISITQATSSVTHNYLLSVPYTTLDATVNYADINIAPLKNYYSPESVQTPVLDSRLKVYNKIHTGLNTQEGHDNIYLSYRGANITKEFKKDLDTYFHYPVSATTIPLSSSTLVESGALGGSVPARSDRIYIKKAGYSRYSNWGTTPDTQNGVLFCSWLSARDNALPIWMDRYYNPDFVNTTSLLTSTSFGSSNNNYPNIIWDVPSTQVLSPESLYVYHRIGDTDNNVIVNSLSGIEVIHVSNWNETIINENTGLEIGEVRNFSSSSVSVFPNTTSECLDTSESYGIINFTNSDIDSSNGITLCFNGYSTDWSDIKGNQIVGNYYNGGIGFVKNNTLLTPFTSIIDFSENSITTFNTSLKSIKRTPTTFSGSVNILKGKYDSPYYIVTSENKLLVYDQDDFNTIGYTLSLSGTIVHTQLIKDGSVDYITVVTQPSVNVLWWYKISTETIGSTTIAVTTGSNVGYNNCIFDRSNTPVYHNGKSATVDSTNQVFCISGDLLVRSINTAGYTPVLSALSAEAVNCDHEDNLWVLYANRNLCKLDNYGNIIWDVYLTSSVVSTNTSSQSRIINFISEIDSSSGKIVHSGLVVDPRTQLVFKVDATDGTILKTASISGGGFYTELKGDTTGYNYQRQYVYNQEAENDISIKLFTRNALKNVNTQAVINLSHDVSNLTPGWHHFAATLDTTNNLNYYIDGNVVESTVIGSLSSIYKVYNNKNNPNLIVGTSSFKKQTLAEYTQESTDVYGFKGKVADVRFYNRALEKSDIKCIQKSFLTTSFSDLKWLCPTGSRYYIEKIERMFLHRLPGAKSNMFNIRIRNSNIINSDLRGIIEKNIVSSLSKIIPVHTKLNSIIWE